MDFERLLKASAGFGSPIKGVSKTDKKAKTPNKSNPSKLF